LFEWFIIFVLAGLVWLQSHHIGTLRRRLTELETRFGALGDALAGMRAPARDAAAAPEAGAPTPDVETPTPVDEREPLVLDTPLRPDEDEPLLLDTPLPDAVNDDELEPLELTQRVEDALVAPPMPEPVRPPPRVREKPSRSLEQWLAEKGLAWIGGGAAAVGAIYLVAYAAGQRWFTPEVQLVCAVVFGLVLLAASEWARRASLRRPPGNPLIAALLAGAGVVAFYAASWAAYGVYHMINMGPAAALLLLCAIILIGLSFLHGQALGVLAIVAALLAPALTNTQQWPTAALTFFVCAVGAAGFSLAALKRWSWVAMATIAGLYFWFASAIAADEIRRALAMLSFAALGGVLLAFRPPENDDDPKGYFSWRSAYACFPPIATVISSVLTIWVWLSVTPMPSGSIGGPAWVGAMFVALAAATVRARVAAPATFAVAIGALIVGFMAYINARDMFGPLGADVYPFLLFCSVWIVGWALFAHPHRTGRILITASGAIGATALVVLAAFTRDEWHSVQAWAVLFAMAAILFGAAWLTAREAPDAAKDRATDIWAGAGAVLVLLGVESAFPAEARTTAHAGAALLFASGLAWLNWRMLGYAALAAAVLAIGHALSPSLLNAALTGGIPIWGALTVLFTTAALLFAAGQVSDRSKARPGTREALTSASVIVVLIAAFLALRWFGAGGAGAPLDALAEQALRAVALISAGHIMMARPGQELGFIGRWRGHVLMCLGLLYALVIPGLSANPWWGMYPASIVGPPVLNTLLLAFAAPAALAGAAAYRFYGRERVWARVYASSAFVFGLIWAMLELRRWFHGADMAMAQVGVFEGACHALVLLCAAIAVAHFGRRQPSDDKPFLHDLALANRATTWSALIIAALILLVLRHPIWGAQFSGDSNDLSSGLGVLSQAAALVLALVLGRLHSMAQPVNGARFACAAAAAALGWSFGHAAIGWFYHQGAMDDGGPLVSIEGFMHAIWPLVFVMGASEVTMRAPGRETVRAYLIDLAAIWATAIWPALAFAGFGLWLLFNPWWGAMPAQAAAPVIALIGLVVMLIAAFLSARATRVPKARWPDMLAYAATVACIIHLFVALTLLVRWGYHPGDMAAPPASGVEMWIYSAAWAVFGALLFALGLRRNDALLRWAGLAVLLATSVKVFLFDTAQLSGVIRAASAIGLAVVLFGVAWIARIYRPAAISDAPRETPNDPPQTTP